MKQILIKYLEENYNSQCPYPKGQLIRMILNGEIKSKPQLIDDLKVL